MSRHNHPPVKFIGTAKDLLRKSYRFEVTPSGIDFVASLEILIHGGITSLPAIAEQAIFEHMKEEMCLRIRDEVTFMPVLDLSLYPKVYAYLDRRVPTDDGTKFGHDVCLAYGKMKEWLRGRTLNDKTDYHGMHYITVNAEVPFTGLKIVMPQPSENDVTDVTDELDSEDATGTGTDMPTTE